MTEPQYQLNIQMAESIRMIASILQGMEKKGALR